MKDKTFEKVGFKWGFIVFILLSAYFGILQLLDFVHILELRLFNGAIMYFGIYMAIKEFKASPNEFTYFKGLGSGIVTSFVATIAFTLFGFGYLMINPAFMMEIKEKEPLGFYINEYGAVIQIFIEGIASGCLMSYANMQFFKIPTLVGGNSVE